MKGARWYRWLVGDENAERLPAAMPWLVLVSPLVLVVSVLVIGRLS